MTPSHDGIKAKAIEFSDKEAPRRQAQSSVEGEGMQKKIMLMVCAGLLATAASAAKVEAQAAPRRVEIDAKRFSYSPGEITLKKGEPVILVLKSEDVAHGLRVRELNINLKTKAGGTAEMQLTPDKTGDFVGHCSVFCGEGHGTMAIKLHVVN